MSPGRPAPGVPARGAYAHAENLGPGGGTRVIAGDEFVGPYRILFTSSPEPAQIGKVTFLVRLSDPKTDEKVRDAEIIVELTHSETGATLSQAATHADAGNPTDYVAHVQVDQTGQWQGVLRVSGPPGPPRYHSCSVWYPSAN